MEKRQTEMKSLKEGGFVLLDDVPCKIVSVQTSKAGKHGAAKVRITAAGIFDNQKKSIVKPGSAKVDVPVIEKKAVQVVSISGDNAQIMDLDDYSISDVPIPEDMQGSIAEGEEIVVWKFGKYTMIKGKKG